jgi:hypothetical protein
VVHVSSGHRAVSIAAGNYVQYPQRRGVPFLGAATRDSRHHLVSNTLQCFTYLTVADVYVPSDMVFAFPKSGVHVAHLGSRDYRNLEVATRSLDTSFSFDLWDSFSDDIQSYQNLGPRVVTASLSEILKPLLVSKQFYKEAMPSFYRINNFVQEGLVDLKSNLSRLATSRLQYITHVSFKYSGNYQSSAKVFKLLKDMKGLRTLNIRVDEASWLSKVPTPQEHPEKYSSVMNMNGMATLRSMRGLSDVKFHGSPTLQSIVRPKLLRREEDNQPSAARVRMRRAMTI